MKLYVFAVAISIVSITASSADICYQHYDKNGQLIDAGRKPPFDISGPPLSLEYQAARDRGEYIVIAPSNSCSSPDKRTYPVEPVSKQGTVRVLIAPPKKSEVSNIPKSPMTTESKEWYKEGTLQGADIQTWLSSDYRNRLATTGDFFAYFSREMNPKLLDVPAHNFVRVMKVYATELEICITRTARDKNSEGFKAAELASLCYTLMFNNK